MISTPPGSARWLPRGEEGDSRTWRYDVAKQRWLAPGDEARSAGLRVQMPANFNPRTRGAGVQIVVSPPGAVAPHDAVTYTPATGEIHDRSSLLPAPVDQENLSLLVPGDTSIQPDPRLQQAPSGGLAEQQPLPSMAGALPMMPTPGLGGGQDGPVEGDPSAAWGGDPAATMMAAAAQQDAARVMSEQAAAQQSALGMLNQQLVANLSQTIAAEPTLPSVQEGQTSLGAGQAIGSGQRPSAVPDSIWQAIVEDAGHEGVDPYLAAALFQQESGFRQAARSPVGAIGIAQLMPATARGLGVNPNDWRDNVRGGVRYLAQMQRQFGDPWLAIAAYNAGPGAVQQHGGIPPYEETRKHNQAIRQYYETLRAETGGQAPAARNLRPLQGVSQNQLGLDPKVAAAFCGPAGVLWFTQHFGRTPTLEEALNLAPAFGWTPQAGAGGPARTAQMINAMGGAAETGKIDAARIRAEVEAGRPVLLSSPGATGHYFQAVDYDPASDRFQFGDAVGAQAGGWHRLADIAGLGFGTPDTGIYVPQAVSVRNARDRDSNQAAGGGRLISFEDALANLNFQLPSAPRQTMPTPQPGITIGDFQSRPTTAQMGFGGPPDMQAIFGPYARSPWGAPPSPGEPSMPLEDPTPAPEGPIGAPPPGGLGRVAMPEGYIQQLVGDDPQRAYQQQAAQAAQTAQVPSRPQGPPVPQPLPTTRYSERGTVGDLADAVGGAMVSRGLTVNGPRSPLAPSYTQPPGPSFAQSGAPRPLLGAPPLPLPIPPSPGLRQTSDEWGREQSGWRPVPSPQATAAPQTPVEDNGRYRYVARPGNMIEILEAPQPMFNPRTGQMEVLPGAQERSLGMLPAAVVSSGAWNVDAEGKLHTITQLLPSRASGGRDQEIAAQQANNATTANALRAARLAQQQYQIENPTYRQAHLAGNSFGSTEPGSPYVTTIGNRASNLYESFSRPGQQPQITYRGVPQWVTANNGRSFLVEGPAGYYPDTERYAQPDLARDDITNQNNSTQYTGWTNDFGPMTVRPSGAPPPYHLVGASSGAPFTISTDPTTGQQAINAYTIPAPDWQLQRDPYGTILAVNRNDPSEIHVVSQRQPYSELVGRTALRRVTPPAYRSTARDLQRGPQLVNQGLNLAALSDLEFYQRTGMTPAQALAAARGQMPGAQGALLPGTAVTAAGESSPTEEGGAAASEAYPSLAPLVLYDRAWQDAEVRRAQGRGQDRLGSGALPYVNAFLGGGTPWGDGLYQTIQPYADNPYGVPGYGLISGGNLGQPAGYDGGAGNPASDIYGAQNDYAAALIADMLAGGGASGGATRGSEEYTGLRQTVSLGGGRVGVFNPLTGELEVRDFGERTKSMDPQEYALRQEELALKRQAQGKARRQAISLPRGGIAVFDEDTGQVIPVRPSDPEPVTFEGGNIHVPAGRMERVLYGMPGAQQAMMLGGGQDGPRDPANEQRSSLGVGQGGWVPPIDPRQVEGTGNRWLEPVSMEGLHKAVDLQAFEGTPVRAPVSGQVTDVRNEPQGLGVQTVIGDGQGNQHTLAHLSQVYVRPGQGVQMGAPVAAVGHTGAGATGSHLDYRIQDARGQHVDPTPLLGPLATLPRADGRRPSDVGRGQALPGYDPSPDRRRDTPGADVGPEGDYWDPDSMGPYGWQRVGGLDVLPNPMLLTQPRPLLGSALSLRLPGDVFRPEAVLIPGQVEDRRGDQPWGDVPMLPPYWDSRDRHNRRDGRQRGYHGSHARDDWPTPELGGGQDALGSGEFGMGSGYQPYGSMTGYPSVDMFGALGGFGGGGWTNATSMPFGGPVVGGWQGGGESFGQEMQQQDGGFGGFGQMFQGYPTLVGQQKWSGGGNSIDVFTPRGATVYAPFSGYVQTMQTMNGPVPGTLVMLTDPNSGFSVRLVHTQPIASGFVQAGQPLASVYDPGMDMLQWPGGGYGQAPGGYQHAQVDIASSPNGFSQGPMGGSGDALQWLFSTGFKPTQMVARTPGPTEGMGGGMGMGGFGGGMMGGFPGMGGMGGGFPGMGGFGGGMMGGFPGMGGMGGGFPGMGGFGGGMGGMSMMGGMGGMGGFPMMGGMGGMGGGFGGGLPMMGGGFGGGLGGFGGGFPMAGGFGGGFGAPRYAQPTIAQAPAMASPPPQSLANPRDRATIDAVGGIRSDGSFDPALVASTYVPVPRKVPSPRTDPWRVGRDQSLQRLDRLGGGQDWGGDTLGWAESVSPLETGLQPSAPGMAPERQMRASALGSGASCSPSDPFCGLNEQEDQQRMQEERRSDLRRLGGFFSNPRPLASPPIRPLPPPPPPDGDALGSGQFGFPMMGGFGGGFGGFSGGFGGMGGGFSGGSFGGPGGSFSSFPSIGSQPFGGSALSGGTTAISPSSAEQLRFQREELAARVKADKDRLALDRDRLAQEIERLTQARELALNELDQRWAIHQDEQQYAQEKLALEREFTQRRQLLDEQTLQVQTRLTLASQEIERLKVTGTLGIQQQELGLNRYALELENTNRARDRQLELYGSALRNPWLQSLGGMAPLWDQPGGPRDTGMASAQGRPVQVPPGLGDWRAPAGTLPPGPRSEWGGGFLPPRSGSHGVPNQPSGEGAFFGQAPPSWSPVRSGAQGFGADLGVDSVLSSTGALSVPPAALGDPSAALGGNKRRGNMRSVPTGDTWMGLGGGEDQPLRSDPNNFPPETVGGSLATGTSFTGPGVGEGAQVMTPDDTARIQSLLGGGPMTGIVSLSASNLPPAFLTWMQGRGLRGDTASRNLLAAMYSIYTGNTLPGAEWVTGNSAPPSNYVTGISESPFGPNTVSYQPGTEAENTLGGTWQGSSGDNTTSTTTTTSTDDMSSTNNGTIGLSLAPWKSSYKPLEPLEWPDMPDYNSLFGPSSPTLDSLGVPGFGGAPRMAGAPTTSAASGWRDRASWPRLNRDNGLSMLGAGEDVDTRWPGPQTGGDLGSSGNGMVEPSRIEPSSLPGNTTGPSFDNSFDWRPSQGDLRSMLEGTPLGTPRRGTMPTAPGWSAPGVPSSSGLDDTGMFGNYGASAPGGAFQQGDTNGGLDTISPTTQRAGLGLAEPLGVPDQPPRQVQAPIKSQGGGSSLLGQYLGQLGGGTYNALPPPPPSLYGNYGGLGGYGNYGNDRSPGWGYIDATRLGLPSQPGPEQKYGWHQGVPSWQDYANMSPFRRAALRAEIEMSGEPWENWLNRARFLWGQNGVTDAAPTTALEYGNLGTRGMLGRNQIAETFGYTPDEYWSNQAGRWARGAASNVAQRV